MLTWGFCGAVYQHEGSAWYQLHPQKEVFPTRGSRSPFRHPGYTKPKPKWDVHMEGGQAAVSVRPSGTFGRASLWRLSQSSSPHKGRFHLGFSLGGRPAAAVAVHLGRVPGSGTGRSPGAQRQALALVALPLRVGIQCREGTGAGIGRRRPLVLQRRIISQGES